MAKTEKEVKNLFKTKGINVTSKDLDVLGAFLEKMMNSGGKISEDDLNEIAGGAFSARNAVGTAVNSVSGILLGLMVGTAITTGPIGLAVCAVVGGMYSPWFRYCRANMV